ncbi:MAG: type I phosphomannose isomerase catalytic subunit [Isosphaeraceae bacterium]
MATEFPAYPLRFEPILKHLIWGGRRLGTVLGKPIGPESDFAESWEISDHANGISEVSEGPLKGTNLRDLVHRYAAEVLGPKLSGMTQFPLLLKFLDANQVLSVQVHPTDEQARDLVNDNGKTEAWVVMHADPDSLIYAGLKPGVTRDDFARALEAGRTEPLLHRFEARPGQCIFIPAGTVHAIGAGVLLAEIQQMSDATFRVDDWGRVGPDGKPRMLHIREAMIATDFDRGPVDPVSVPVDKRPWGTREALVNCRYFALERWRLTSMARIGSVDRFTILVGIGGTSRIGDVRLGYGESLLMPASLGEVDILPEDEATILICTVP